MTSKSNPAMAFLKAAIGARTEGASDRLMIEDVMPSQAALERATQVIRAPKSSDIQRTAEKIAKDQVLDPLEQMILEAIIIPDKRPAIDVINGAYAVTHPLWTHLETDVQIRSRIEAVIPSVGRIELPGNDLVPYAGSGFVVGESLLMTNRHVAAVFAGGPGDLSFQPGAAAGVDFLRERPADGGDGGSVLLSVKEVVMIHPYWDMALLRVDGLDEDRPPLTLSLLAPDQLTDREVALIGYPAFDPRNNAEVQDRVFGGTYNVKRLMPGVITGSGRTASFGKQVPSIKHDASTLGGASGSCVVDTEVGDIIALHFGGQYLRSNFGVPSSDLAKDGRIIDAGVAFSAAPVRSSGDWDRWWNEIQPASPPQSSGSSPPAKVCDAPVDKCGVETVAATAGRALRSVTVRVEFSE